MADISIINKDNTDYNVKDAAGRLALAEVENKGAKNILNVLLAENYRAGQEGNFPITTGNVTFSENGGVITTSGTASATLTLRAPVYLPVGTYYISGSPASGSDTTYRTDLREQGTNTMISAYRDYGSGFEVEITTARTVDWCIRIQSGFDATGLTFYPMICTKAEWDISQAYAPFARTNRELTVLTDEDRASLVELVDGRSKNIATINDGNNGTLRYIEIPLTAAAGDYLLNFGSLASTDTDATTCNVAFFLGTTRSSDNVKVNRGANITQIISTTGADSLRVYASDTSDHSQNDTVTISDFMVCTPAAWKISQSFQPYAPTNRELYCGELQYEMVDIVDNLDATFVDKTNSRFNIHKFGRFCFADFSLKMITANLTGNDVITSTALPQRMRPVFDFYGTATARDNGTWAMANMIPVSFAIGASNGIIQLRSGTGSSSTLYITATMVWCV